MAARYLVCRQTEREREKDKARNEKKGTMEFTGMSGLEQLTIPESIVHFRGKERPTNQQKKTRNASPFFFNSPFHFGREMLLRHGEGFGKKGTEEVYSMAEAVAKKQEEEEEEEEEEKKGG
ncbi:hypothetical protein ACJQWK_07339 [Exserohilum turcicum]